MSLKYVDLVAAISDVVVVVVDVDIVADAMKREENYEVYY